MDRSTSALRGCRALFAAALFGAASLATPSIADDAPSADVYIGVTPTSRQPVMVYVLSDSTQPGIQEQATFALTVVDDVAGTTEFDPEKICVVIDGYSLQDNVENRSIALSKRPIYGPNSEQQKVLAPDLAIFMSRETAKALLVNNLVENQSAATPFFNCAGWFWARLVKQPPEFWDKTYRDIISEKQQ
ncbi:MAG: hypothetical protein AAGM38_01130 [Pseudomonadota bacterium]